MSSRERRPQTGRSNLGEYQHRNSPEFDNASMSSSSIIKVDPAKVRQMNDPLHYHRPFSPKDPFFNESKALPPVLPRSRYPTIPENEPEALRQRPTTCPPTWLEKSQQVDVFERSSMNGNLNEDLKKKYCQSFVERNLQQLWKFDTAYLRKTPRTVCGTIVNDPDYMGIMTRNIAKEKVFRLSGSDQTKNCLTYPDAGFSSHRGVADPFIVSSHRGVADPFIVTLTTSRVDRERRRIALLGSSPPADKSNRRGYKHAPEYGNFSRFNGVLKSNQAAVMKR